MEGSPKKFERVYTPELLEAFVANFTVIHEHAWLGGEITDVTYMSEGDYYKHDWYCQFCGVIAEGENLDYASQRPRIPEQLKTALAEAGLLPGSSSQE